MWLALETSADLASVAVGAEGAPAAEVVVQGPRRHASMLLPAVEQVLARGGLSPGGISGIVLADGPGSFTGLRVAATVAKALAHDRGLPLRAASSLLVMAFGGWWDTDPESAAGVRAVSDALRGEVYAAQYRISRDAIGVELAPGVFRPEDLPVGLSPPDLLVRALPPALAARVAAPPGAAVREGSVAAPRAATLLRLLAVPGGTGPVTDVSGWEPVYGRPAEAQARWEAAHGRPLPDPGRPQG